MKYANLIKKTFLFAVITGMAITSFAERWDWATPYRGPKQDIINLIITSNYKKPLLMAQLIQYETRQPYILLPVRKDGGIYFCPVNNKKPALEIKKENLARFISFLNPKRIIILGDETYVPEKFLKSIDKNIPTVTVSGDDWDRAAVTLTNLLGITNLKYDFARLSKKLEKGSLYRPSKGKVSEPPKSKDDLILEATPADTKAEEASKGNLEEAKIESNDAKAEDTDKKVDKVTDLPKEPEVAIPEGSTPELIKAN
ncbi:hypothetical protein P0136_05055 [Lentisphaerota bacterium ZTH]|nr:hypothetical protein JYG24_03830 [Lentisphaerota bacterium]WET07359.1 hypothetical protein P0136_05055 [Lentisphaerota bacterium ZTH]